MITQPLILELDEYWKGNPARLPWGAVDDNHCIATLPYGTVIEASRVEGGIRLVATPAEGSQVPHIDEVRPDVPSLMEVVFDRLVERASMNDVAQSSMVKAKMVSALLQRVRVYGTPSKMIEAAGVIKRWQSGLIDVNETIRQMEEINDRIIEKNLSPIGKRSLARKHKN